MNINTTTATIPPTTVGTYGRASLDETLEPMRQHVRFQFMTMSRFHLTFQVRRRPARKLSDHPNFAFPEVYERRKIIVKGG